MSIELLFVLDRSGSMQDLQDRTISDVNELINKYKQTEDSFMSLIQFDDQYEMNYIHQRVQDVPNLNKDTYQPRGSTALYDAICRTIDEAGEKFAKLPAKEREELNVVLAVFTDGLENASRNFRSEDVKKRIEHQQKNYGWQFMFMGADERAVLAARNVGFSHDNTLKMSSNPAARQYTMHALADKLGAYGPQGASGPIGAAGLSWNATDREEANK
jgi:uncharacterized protein YegL